MTLPTRMRILHIITGLDGGGAERSLANLLTGRAVPGHYAHVVSLDTLGEYGPMLLSQGIGVDALNIAGGRRLPQALFALRRIVRNHRPHIIQGWMYHGNLAASLTQRMAGFAVPVAWNIRQSLYDIVSEKPMTRWIIRRLAAMSDRPDAIIYNSHQSRTHHEAFGFASPKGTVIPNGFDAEMWRPDTTRRQAMRRELGFSDQDFVLGFVGRDHPQKDVPTFLRACEIAMAANADLHVVMAGNGLTATNPALSPALARLPAARTHLVGRSTDVPALMNGFDIFCLSSSSEAFPNVLGEAMASALPCIATNVGDCARLLDGHGLVVPPSNPPAMAEAIVTLASMDVAERREIGQAARTRIVTNYGLGATIDRYGSLYESLAGVKE